MCKRLRDFLRVTKYIQSCLFLDWTINWAERIVLSRFLKYQLKIGDNFLQFYFCILFQCWKRLMLFLKTQCLLFQIGFLKRHLLHWWLPCFWANLCCTDFILGFHEYCCISLEGWRYWGLLTKLLVLLKYFLD